MKIRRPKSNFQQKALILQAKSVISREELTRDRQKVIKARCDRSTFYTNPIALINYSTTNPTGSRKCNSEEWIEMNANTSNQTNLVLENESFTSRFLIQKRFVWDDLVFFSFFFYLLHLTLISCNKNKKIVLHRVAETGACGARRASDL